jgi:hypothetical protein
MSHPVLFCAGGNVWTARLVPGLVGLHAATLGLLLFPELALACSPGPGVDRAAFYAMIERPPYVLGGASVVAAALWLLLRGRANGRVLWPALLVGLALMQPAWWVKNMGDCGLLRDGYALLTALASITVLIVGLRCTRKRAVEPAVAQAVEDG